MGSHQRDTDQGLRPRNFKGRQFNGQKWRVPNKLLEKVLEVKLLVNNWLQKLQEKAHHLLVESRNPIVIGPVPLPFQRLVREIAQDFKTDLRFQSAAIGALQ